MSYTLTTWALWLLAAAAIGLVSGWLLGRLSQPAATEPEALETAALEPLLPTRAAEVEHLRSRVAELQRALDAERAEPRPTVAAQPAQVPAPTPDASAESGADDWEATARAAEQLASELRVRLWNAEALLADTRAELQAARDVTDARDARDASDAQAARGAAAGHQPPAQDDLTAIEGIGPRIAELCRNHGYDTWERLGAAEAEDLRHMLEAAGPRYRVHDPSHWAEQARLLAAGDWDGVRRLVASLHAGTAGK